MTAKLQILCGPAGSGKTQRLLHRFQIVAKAQMGGALWLGPTHRQVVALRERLLPEQGSYLQPHVLTMQDFIDEIVRANDPAARPLSDVQRRLLSDEVVAHLDALGELSHFHKVIDTCGFAEGIFAWLADLKHNEIRPGAFARAAYRRGYEGKQVGNKVNWHVISKKDRQCAKIYAKYQQWIRKHHFHDLEDRCYRARDLLTSGR